MVKEVKVIYLRWMLFCLLILSPTLSHGANLQSLEKKGFALRGKEVHLDCTLLPCADVVPGADRFEPVKGLPFPVEKAYKGEKFLGYVFLSSDIVDVPAYSGKPIVTLIGMDEKGTIIGTKIIVHSEPILLVGIPVEKLFGFASQYVGINVRDKVRFGKTGEPGVKVVDAISGATVTAIAENKTIMVSARRVAEALGIVERSTEIVGHLVEDYRPMTWQELLDEGLLGHLRVMPEQVGYKNEEGRPWVDIYFAYLNLPMAGRNLIGEHYWEWIKKDFIDKGYHVFLVVSNGISTFKGSGFVRGGIFDRFNFEQNGETFTFRDLDYTNFAEVQAKGAPTFKEGGIFVLKEKRFNPLKPFTFTFLSPRIVSSIKREFYTFKKDYSLPSRYVVIERVEGEEEMPTWVTIWKGAIYDVVFFVLFLLLVLSLFIGRDYIVKRRGTAKWIRYTVMAVSLFFVGFYKMAQPSVTQLLTVIHKFVTGWEWSLFLSDPIIFITWWFIALTIIFWGRGVFCGWICPYGALTEFIYRIFHRVFPERLRYEFPYPVHRRLVYLKYGVFLFLLVVSFYSMPLAERFAEVEPFKTAFLVGLNRQWPYVVYFFLLLALCLVSYRFFCKYICPLGAGLAVPSTFSIAKIKRRDFCERCKICARDCDIGAIDEKGRINKRECLWCLACEENYWDVEKCPPLIKERKKGREEAV